MNPFVKFAYRIYKWLFVIPFIVLNTLVSAAACIFTGILFGREKTDIIAVLWSRLCCAVIPLKVRITGKENYSPHSSYIIVSNHQSMLDIPAMHGFIGLSIKWIMKKELGRIPVFGTACSQLGCIYVDRSNHDAAVRSIRRARKKLLKNDAVLFFAEGTRSRDGKLLPFKKGAFRFALETGLPILPVTIRNSIDLLPSDTLDLKPGTVDIIVHPSISVNGVRPDSLSQVIDRTRQAVQSGLDLETVP